jgi:intergrase/recombinase
LKYHQCYRNPSELLSIPVTIRSNVLKSMIALSKYLGTYETYKLAIKNHGIKWANNNDSLTAFVRILNGNNLKDLTLWYQRALTIFNDNEKLYLRFLALSGVRKTEAKLSFDKIRAMSREDKLSEYYNSETKMLEHFRYKQFLRGTKNLYVSAVPYELIQQIANANTSVSLASMRKKLNRHGLTLRFKELRQFYATDMRRLGLMQELISLLQGRVERTVFTQFYLKENPKELADNTITLLSNLEKTLSLNS